MTLSDISIKKPVFAWMLMAATIVFGAIALSRLGISQFPDVDMPTVTIQVTWEGAAPEIMESEIADILEDAVMSVEGVKQVRTTCKHSSCTIAVEFDLKIDINVALQDVQAKVSQVQRRLPRDMDPPVISKANPEDQPIMWIGLSGYKSEQELSDYAKYTLRDQIQTAHPGIAEVMMGGFLERNVRVWLDAKKLEAYGLTVDDIILAIQKEHIQVPAGKLEGQTRELVIRFEGEASSIEKFKQIVISETGGSQIQLQDVAVIEDGLQDRRRLARSNGFPAVGMGIKKMRGANTVEVAKAIRAKIEKLQEMMKTSEPELDLFVSFDISGFIEESITEVGMSIILAVIFTGIVCWMFLGSFSSTMNVILAIPTSLLGTFAVMYFAGFTLNMITLLALSLSIGIVVDDSIMVLENIHRHAEGGKSKREAALVGAREITFAALVATIAIIAIFLPVAFMSGIVGKFFFQFGVVLSVAVAFSYLEAVTLTPARCSQILNVGKRRTWIGRVVEGAIHGLSVLYKKILPFCIKKRYAVVAISLVLFIGSLNIFQVLGKELTPAQDMSRFLVRFQAPVGSSIEVTNSLVQKCEKIIASKPEVKRYFCAIGGFGGGEVDTGVMFVTLVPPHERKLSADQIIGIIRREFNSIPGLVAIMLDLSRQDPTGSRNYPVQFTLKGPDWDTLVSSAQKAVDEMKASGKMVDVDSNYRLGAPEVRVIPDQKRSADANVSIANMGNTISALMGGIRVAKFEEQGRRYDIRVRLLKPQRLRPEDISPLMVKNKQGELVPLSDLVVWKEKPSIQAITRENRQRAITITANLAAGVPQATAVDESIKIARANIPEGYVAELSGGAETMRETMQGLIFAIILGIIVAYMVLASQFNSFIHPFTVLIALPFSITGALLALWLFNATISMLSMLGIILLMGIVKKNSIILVDFTNQKRAEGLSHNEALLEACPVRLRPILMTSISTLAGAIPTALAIGASSSFRIPMALTIIGGIIVSTLLTLLVVPSVYSIFEDIKRLFGFGDKIKSQVNTP